MSRPGARRAPARPQLLDHRGQPLPPSRPTRASRARAARAVHPSAWRRAGDRPSGAPPKIGYTALGPTELSTGGRRGYGYDVASQWRASGQPVPAYVSPDMHARFDRRLLGRIGDQLDRNSAIVEGVANRWVDAVLGPKGFVLRPMTGDDQLDARILRDWKNWGKKGRCEVRGLFSRRRLFRMAAREIFRSGDCGLAILRNEKLQFFASAEIGWGAASEGGLRYTSAGNAVEDGVELDSVRRPVAFHVTPYSDLGIPTGKTKRFSAANFVHPAYRKWVGNTRGIGVMQAAWSMAHRIDDVTDSEALAWQLLSRFAVAINRKGGPSIAYDESEQRQSLSPEQRDPTDGRVSDYDYALVFQGEPGEDVRGIDRNVPGQQFEPSIRMFLRLLGIGIGLPLEKILLDYTGVSYTGGRAVEEQCKWAFAGHQDWIADDLYDPVYEAFLGWGIAAGRYPDRPETFLRSWQVPVYPWIDIEKESKGWMSKLAGGMATLQDAHAALGIDTEEFYLRRGREIRRAIKEAQAITKELGEFVPWQIFAGLEMSKQALLGQEQGAAPAPAPEADA